VRPCLLLLALGSLLATGAGCFKEPKPKCSFLCGASGACPDGYVCGATDNRCHLVDNGAPAACEDTLPPDGPPVPDSDTTFDTAPVPDGTPDASPPDASPPDAPVPDADIPDATID